MTNHMFRKLAMAGCSFAALLAVPSFAQEAPTAAAGDQPEDVSGVIIVTANKRNENLQDTGVTVQAIGGDTLTERNITSLGEITKLVPGLSFAATANNTPVLTLRGVGFFDSTLASYPNVSLYLDQAPLAFPTTASQTAFDLERVEVVKGPQGTLFGNNSTGGAINYIANKPSETAGGGLDLTYGRFGRMEVATFVTGPLSETLKVRLAAKTVQGGDWQKSYTRDDKLGESNSIAGRLLVDWEPTSRLRVSINLNGWQDKSDPIAPQFVKLFNQGVPLPPEISAYPTAPASPRAADWNPVIDHPRANNRMVQAIGRIDFDVTDDITLTSISSYVDYKHDQSLEGDGTALISLDVPNTGTIESFAQELRLGNGGSGPIRWLLGGNYEHSDVDEANEVHFPAASGAFLPFFYQAGNSSNQRMRNYAAFANVEFDITDSLTLKGGIRQTRAERSSINRSYPVDNDAKFFLKPAFEAYRFFVLGLADPTIPESFFPGPFLGGAADPATGLPGLYYGKLNEDSTSWLAGVNYKPADDVMLYANVSKGYKAGGFPTLSASFWSQFEPVTQESLVDYEVGFKTQFLDRRVTFNGAAFYYDYRDKQLRSKIIDPLFGILDAIKNVPKSTVKGFEFDLSARPVQGLSVYLQGTYLDTRVDRYVGIVGSTINPQTGFFEPVTANLAGERLPFAPKWQFATGASGNIPLSAAVELNIGADLRYQSNSTSVLGSAQAMADTRIDASTIVDARIGISDRDKRWSLTLFGKNIFNEYYWTNSLTTFDTVVRYAGRPAEYGVTATFRF